MWTKKKKKFKGDPLLLLGIHFCYCVYVALQLLIVYILFFIIYLEEFFFKGLGSSHSNLRIEWEKNNSFNIFKNKPNIIISHFK